MIGNDWDEKLNVNILQKRAIQNMKIYLML